MSVLRRYGLLAILALAALLALGQVNQHLILASDNASYIVLGQALALGRGYTMINEPLAPAMNLYPFGYPLLLATVLKLTGAVTQPLQAVVPMKLVTVLFFLASLPVLYAVVRHRHGHLLAALVTALVAVNPDVLTLATEILSDVPFLFLALLGLLLAEMCVDIQCLPAFKDWKRGRAEYSPHIPPAPLLSRRTGEKGGAVVDRGVLQADSVGLQNPPEESSRFVSGGRGAGQAGADIEDRADAKANKISAGSIGHSRQRTTAGVRRPEHLQWVLLLAAGLALAAAYYMRSAGLALLAAVPLYFVLHRRWRAGIVLAIFLGVLALPWFLRSSAPPTPETPFFARSYIHQVLALAPYSEEKVSALGLAGRIVGNSLAYGVDILPEALFPHIGRLGGWARAALALLVLLGFALEVRRGVRPGEVAVAAYWLSLSLFVWVLGFRYILFVMPFAFVYLLTSVQWLTRAAGQGLSRRCHSATVVGREEAAQSRAAIVAVAAVAAVLLVSALAVDLRRVERNLTTLRHQTLAQVYAGNAEWSRWLEAVSWLQRSAPGDAVIMARKPDLLYLLSGRLTVEYPYTKNTDVLVSTLSANGVTHVLEDAFTWTRTTETYLTPAMSGQPVLFALVYETAAPRTRVWRVQSPGLDLLSPPALLSPRPKVVPQVR